MPESEPQEHVVPFSDRPFRERRPFSYNVLKAVGVVIGAGVVELLIGGSDTGELLKFTGVVEAPIVLGIGCYLGEKALNEAIEADRIEDARLATTAHESRQQG